MPLPILALQRCLLAKKISGHYGQSIQSLYYLSVGCLGDLAQQIYQSLIQNVTLKDGKLKIYDKPILKSPLEEHAIRWNWNH